MKIEFAKETKVDGGEMFYTIVDGSYVSNSLSHKIENAKTIYDNIVKNKGKINFIEILESIELEIN